MNMALHDQLVLERIGRSIDDPVLDDLRLLNAGLNVVGFIAWAAYNVRPLHRPRLLGYSDHVAIGFEASTE
jgi:hypothetical protein